MSDVVCKTQCAKYIGQILHYSVRYSVLSYNNGGKNLFEYIVVGFQI